MLLETYDVYRQKYKPNKAFLEEGIFKFIFCAKTNWFHNNSHPMLRFSITTGLIVFLFSTWVFPVILGKFKKV